MLMVPILATVKSVKLHKTLRGVGDLFEKERLNLPDLF
jgi:hypothetical protein